MRASLPDRLPPAIPEDLAQLISGATYYLFALSASPWALQNNDAASRGLSHADGQILLSRRCGGLCSGTCVRRPLSSSAASWRRSSSGPLAKLCRSWSSACKLRKDLKASTTMVLSPSSMFRDVSSCWPKAPAASPAHWVHLTGGHRCQNRQQQQEAANRQDAGSMAPT